MKKYRVLSIRIKELIRKVLKSEVRFGGQAPVLGSGFEQNLKKLKNVKKKKNMRNMRKRKKNT